MDSFDFAGDSFLFKQPREDEIVELLTDTDEYDKLRTKGHSCFERLHQAAFDPKRQDKGG